MMISLVFAACISLVIALSLVLTGPRMAAIGRALAGGKGTVSPTLRSLANNPMLWISIQTRVANALGIVFLKIAKPDWGWSLLTIGVAIVLGLLSALPVARREGARVASAEWTGSVREGP